MEKNIFSRRHFLLAGGAGLTLLRGATQTARPTFEEVPPTASGIVWAHDNAASAEHYLPETMGPGCAFLDYDNDGWMDIYLVNSGPCDFFTAARAHPQRALQEQPRRHLHRRHRKGRGGGRHLRHGRGGGRLRQRRLPRHVRHRLRPPDSLPQQRQRHLHRRHREGRPGRQGVRGPLDAPAPSGSTTTTTAGSTCSSAASWITASRATSLRRQQAGADVSTASRASSSPPPACCSTTTATARSPRSASGTDIEKALGKGLGVVATDINNDGRMDLFVANDTVQNFLFVNRGPDAKGKTRWEEIALAAEVGFSDDGQRPFRHGRGRRRFRRRRLAGSVRRQRRPGDVLALPQQPATRLFATWRSRTAWPRPPAC